MIDVASYIRTQLPRHTKSDGSLYYDCFHCRGEGKLEVDAHRPIWFCHKCQLGGRMDGDARRVRNHAITVIDVVDSDEKILEFYVQAETDSQIMKYLHGSRNLRHLEIYFLRPHHGPNHQYFFVPYYPLGQYDRPWYFLGVKMRGIGPKYLCPRSDLFPVKKHEILWGLHRIRGPMKNLTVVEGIFDAVHTKDRVALGGKTISWSQVELIRRISPREVTVMLDGGTETESVQVGSEIGRALNVPIWIVRLPEGRDPDDLRDGVKPFMDKKERLL